MRTLLLPLSLSHPPPTSVPLSLILPLPLLISSPSPSPPPPSPLSPPSLCYNYNTFSVQECSLLPAPDNGSVSVAELVPDSLARYSCNGGFRLVGDSYRVCLRNENWSGKEPFCGKCIVSHTTLKLCRLEVENQARKLMKREK